MANLHKAVERLEDGLFLGSREMGPPWGPLLRFLRYPAALIRDWLSGELNVRAMGLAYTTLLSLVPLLAFSFSILKGLGARGDLAYLVGEFFRPMGIEAVQLTARVMQFVGNVRGGVLGSIGLAFLIYTVIATIQKVEESFNFVWRVQRPRSIARRLSEYLSVMIVGPILMAVAVGLLASAQSSGLARWLATMVPLGDAISSVAKFMPYLIVTAVFTFMYAFIPNTRVKFAAALIGGVSAGVLWALVGKIFTAFILYSSQMMAIYTGFAIVLTSLIWVYLSWLILLIGAQLAFYVQYPQYLRHGQEPIALTGSAREQVGLSVMFLIGRDFGAGKTFWTGNRLAHELDIPSAALAPVLACLERAGLIVATEREHFVPGRDTAGIMLADIFDAVRLLQPGRLMVTVRSAAPVAAVMDLIEASMHERLAGQSLKGFIEAEGGAVERAAAARIAAP
jgi:membrane protein